MSNKLTRERALELLRGGAEGVQEFNRLREPLKAYDLHGINLSGINLSGADLTRAALHEANLTRAGLQRADLHEANLTEADLSGTDLCGANLFYADLTGANLTGAILAYATFTAAKLSGTNLTESKFQYTVFANVNLAYSIGLESVRHGGPSTIGIDTLSKSRFDLPDAFLRGCGVPESLITYQRSFNPSPIDFYSCFISYSHADKSFARRLHDTLQGRGIRCWLDEHAIEPGDDIYAEVDKGIRLYDKILLCASEASLKSWWVKREVDTAFEREMDLTKKRGTDVLSLIPLNLDGALFDWNGPHAAALRKRLAPDFTNWRRNNDKFEKSFERVVKALTLNSKPGPPEPKL